MMIAEIEGTLDEILGLNDIDGLDLQRGVHDLGNGRYKANAIIRRNEAKAEIEGRGMTVRVTMDEAEIDRRSKEQRDTMKAATPDAGSSGGGGDTGNGGNGGQTGGNNP